MDIEQVNQFNDDKIDLSTFIKQNIVDYQYLTKEKISKRQWNYNIIKDISNGLKSIGRCYIPPYDIKSIEQAIYINKKLNHPSILKYVGYSLTDFENKPNPIILMEYSKVIFYDNIIRNDVGDDYYLSELTDTQKLIIIYGIAIGMSYLHSHNIIHRNLKLENILIDESFYPKINGFDYSIEIPSNFSQTESIKELLYKGSPRYFSPEIRDNIEYSKSSDVYAFGILMYEIISNKKFYFANNGIKNALECQFFPKHFSKSNEEKIFF